MKSRRQILVALGASALNAAAAHLRVAVAAATPESAGAITVLRGGETTPFASVGEACAALQDGDTLNIGAGRYGTGGRISAHRVTVQGIGGRAAFTEAVESKAVFVIAGDDCTLIDLGAEDVHVDGDNGGLVRGEGRNLTLVRPYARRCDMPVLTGYRHLDSVVVITDCDLADTTTTGGGRGHGIYVGLAAKLVMNGGTVSNTGIGTPGHLVKSRAAVTEIHGGTFDKGRGARCFDVPEGGMLVINGGARLVNSPTADNREMIAYGAELPRDANKRGIARYPMNEIHIDATVVFVGADPADNLPAFAWLMPTVLDDRHRTEALPPPAPPPPVPAGTVVAVERDALGNVPDSWWASLPKRKWLTIADTKLVQVKPSIDPAFVEYGSGVDTANLGPIMGAWSGGACSEVRQEFLGSGGGHRDSNNGMLYRLDLRTLKFGIQIQPSLMNFADYQHTMELAGYAVGSDDWRVVSNFSQGYYDKDSDETKDHLWGTTHTYGRMCVDPRDGTLYLASAADNWRVKPGATKPEKMCPANTGSELFQVFYNGCVYRAGHFQPSRASGRRGGYLVVKFDPAANKETAYDAGIYFDGAGPNWLDAETGRWWWYGEQHVDLSGPVPVGRPPHGGKETSAGIVDRLGFRGRLTNPFDQSGAWIKGRGYFLGWGPNWGRLIEVECNVGAPCKWTEIASTIGNLKQPNYNYGRFFAVQRHNALILLPASKEDMRVFML